MGKVVLIAGHGGAGYTGALREIVKQAAQYDQALHSCRLTLASAGLEATDDLVMAVLAERQVDLLAAIRRLDLTDLRTLVDWAEANQRPDLRAWVHRGTTLRYPLLDFGVTREQLTRYIAQQAVRPLEVSNRKARRKTQAEKRRRQKAEKRRP